MPRGQRQKVGLGRQIGPTAGRLTGARGSPEWCRPTKGVEPRTAPRSGEEAGDNRNSPHGAAAGGKPSQSAAQSKLEMSQEKPAPKSPRYRGILPIQKFHKEKEEEGCRIVKVGDQLTSWALLLVPFVGSTYPTTGSPTARTCTGVWKTALLTNALILTNMWLIAVSCTVVP